MAINVLGRPIGPQVLFDVGVTYDSSGKGTPKEVEPGDDLSSRTKQDIAQFASDVTHGVLSADQANRFPVGFNGYSEVSITSKDGVPVPIDSSTNTSDRTAGTGRQFLESKGELDTIEAYSDSTSGRGTTSLKTQGDISFLRKGKSISPAEVDGNTALRSGLGTIEDRYVSPILSNNRFTVDRPSGTDQTVRINPSHPPETLGSYRAFRESRDGHDLNDGDFANVGALLTLRATAELGSDGAYGAGGPDGVGATAASIVPGTAQVGLSKVSNERLRAIEALQALIDDNTTTANLDPRQSFSNHLVDDTMEDSFGQLNNVLEPFSGLLPLGMIAASTALVLALKLAIGGLTSLLALVSTASSTGVRKDSQGRYLLGSFVRTPTNGSSFPPLPVPASLLGLRQTVHDFQSCVDKGIEQSFGAGLGGSFERVLESPGYYAVFCRTIVRSASQIVIAVQRAIKGNPVQVAENIIELINVLRSSKVIAAINVMAEIGDAVLTLQDRAFETEDILGVQKVSTIDALDDDVRQGKGRLNGSLVNALANSTSPSAFLLPRSFMAGVAAFSQLQAGAAVQVTTPVMVTNDASLNEALKNRLDQSVVQRVEAELDAEYVPFYFHDLRTNEIVSFHAFLTSLSDDFTVESEASKGYGRVDPVKIYKSTERKIGLEFWAVSTNKDDFDQMWWKINKLVTMVYPQWSRGARLVDPQTGDSFIQPFSQIPTNSPLIRIRLGDLLRSNYSKFALARLFGLGQSDTFFNADINEDAFTRLSTLSEAFAESDFAGFRDLDIKVEPGTYSVVKPEGLTVSLGPKNSVPFIVVREREPGRVTEKNSDGTYNVRLTEAKDNPLILVQPDNVVVDRITLAEVISREARNISTADINKIQHFLDRDQNSIVRSFENVSGKGLACFIDSLGFNWLESIPWETEAYGSRAPKMCRIRLSVTPLHDIAPGIDSDGFNRAPVYNVGEVVNGFGGDAWDETGQGRTTFDSLRLRMRKVLR